MSLHVSPEVLAQAIADKVDPEDFFQTIKQSLPHAWKIVSNLALLKTQEPNQLAEHAPAHMDDETRGQLLRMFASDAIRKALQQTLGFRMAFRNCHAVALFGVDEQQAYDDWTSAKAQILAQSPDQVDC